MLGLNVAGMSNFSFLISHYLLLLVCKYVITHYQVVIAVGFHLFPFRTEKLSPLAPMVLQCNAGE